MKGAFVTLIKDIDYYTDAIIASRTQKKFVIFVSANDRKTQLNTQAVFHAAAYIKMDDLI